MKTWARGSRKSSNIIHGDHFTEVTFKGGIVSDAVVREVRRKWKRSDSSDSDSVTLMTLLTTIVFDFH